MRDYLRAALAKRFGRRAVTSIEYALIIAFIAIVIVSSVAAVGNSLKTPMTTVSEKLSN